MSVKRFATAHVKAAGDGETGNGAFSAILSTSNVDRDGETIKAYAFEKDAPLPLRITIDADHGMSVEKTVGSAVPSYTEDGELRVDGEFASTPLAQEVRTLVNEGHISTMSVAFMNAKYASKGSSEIISAELLNGSFVAIPSNRESVVLSSKELSQKVGARNSMKDAERIQAIHDHALALGAKASTSDGASEDSESADDAAADTAAGAETDSKSWARGHAKFVRRKAVAGSYEQRQQAVMDALDQIYETDWSADEWEYAYPRSTFDDSVVFHVGGNTDNNGNWQASYTVNSDGTVTLGTPRRVTLVEQVIPVDTANTSEASSDAGSSDDTATAEVGATASTLAVAPDSAEAKRAEYRRRIRSRQYAAAAASAAVK